MDASEPKGYDELNLAEFPLASISDRYLDGKKTVIFEDQVWDREQRMHLPSSLTISGSDRYGLPTAKDDDVLLACIQLSSYGNFCTEKVLFSRYELLKLLRWKDETRNYRRLATSLRRWKGVTVYSNRAFYDRERKSWVNRDFGVLDNLYLYERESYEGKDAPASSWLVWNEVMMRSFQAGYLKRLDWNLYCRLERALSKRLYRFLDKRFYRGDTVKLDLHELAYLKLRMPEGYHVGEIKRRLDDAIEELVAKWELKPCSREKRYIKQQRGKWSVVFTKRRRRKAKQAKPVETASTLALDLASELVKREVGPATAEELAEQAKPTAVKTAIELHDWYNERGQPRGPGFLVNVIRRPESLRLPRGFESSASRCAKQERKERNDAEQRRQSQRQAKARAEADAARSRPFDDYWSKLSSDERERFETQAVNQTEPCKRSGYFRAMGLDNSLFEGYRKAILLEHFERNNSPAIHRK